MNAEHGHKHKWIGTESSMDEDLHDQSGRFFPPGEPPYAGDFGSMVQLNAVHGHKNRWIGTESSMDEDLHD